MSSNTDTNAPAPTKPEPTKPEPTTSKPTNTTSASSAAQTHTIKVGPKEDPHQYVPHEVAAKVGDLIVFQFHPRNHSVVQADWKAPCVPADGDYFFSGIKNDFNEVNGQVSGVLPTWNWTVPREEPIFFYCTAIDSCFVNGMVGVINPSKQKSWQAQKKAATDAPYMLVPGQSIPAEGDPGTGTTATHSPSETSFTSNTPVVSSNHLGGGVIAGIVFGVVAFVAILCALIYLLARNQVYKKFFSQSYEGASTSEGRTAQWALSTSASAAAAGTGRSEVDTGSTGIPRHMSPSVRGASPVNEPGGFGAGPMTVPPGFASMDQNLAQAQSGVYSPPEDGHGILAPLGSQMQYNPLLQPGQQQQPYWIWDQSIQPRHLVGRTGGPSELEAETPK